jgi:hypothetical protein
MKLRHLITVLILALALPSQILAQGNKTEQEIYAVIAELKQATLKGGAMATAEYKKHWADDCAQISADGTSATKADVLDHFRAGRTTSDAVEYIGKVRVFGHTAIVTGIATTKAELVGASNVERARWMRVLVKRGHTWKCVLYQATTIAPERKTVRWSGELSEAKER